MEEEAAPITVHVHRSGNGQNGHDSRRQPRPKSARRKQSHRYQLRVSDADPGIVEVAEEEKGHNRNHHYRARAETQNERMIRASSAAVMSNEAADPESGAALRSLTLQRSQTNGYRDRELVRDRCAKPTPRRQSHRVFDGVERGGRRRRKATAIMCSHSHCSCSKYVRPSSKHWNKGRCRECNHKQQEHNKIYYVAEPRGRRFEDSHRRHRNRHGY